MCVCFPPPWSTAPGRQLVLLTEDADVRPNPLPVGHHPLEAERAVLEWGRAVRLPSAFFVPPRRRPRHARTPCAGAPYRTCRYRRRWRSTRAVPPCRRSRSGGRRHPDSFRRGGQRRTRQLDPTRRACRSRRSAGPGARPGRGPLVLWRQSGNGRGWLHSARHRALRPTLVVANDRIRALGWEADYSNEEVWVVSHDPSPLEQLLARRRRTGARCCRCACDRLCCRRRARAPPAPSELGTRSLQSWHRTPTGVASAGRWAAASVLLRCRDAHPAPRRRRLACPHRGLPVGTAADWAVPAPLWRSRVVQWHGSRPCARP